MNAAPRFPGLLGLVLLGVSAASTAQRVPTHEPALSEKLGGSEPRWLPTFGGHPGFGQPVNALAPFDDGSGTALYAAGNFVSVEGRPAEGIARWDGLHWSPVGQGLIASTSALTVFDDGAGPALYAGGNILSSGGVTVNGIARWDGTTWSGIGAANSVNALAVFDDGRGAALYAGGTFTSIGGVSAQRLARWDGSAWSALGAANDTVTKLAVFDSGTGPALYAAGNFTSIGGIAANHIARWDGSAWSALGSGLCCFPFTMLAFDDGGGPALYVGGLIQSAGGQNIQGIARWDGTSWSAVGPITTSSANIRALVAYDDGSGPALYATGSMTNFAGTSARNIARWDGTSWSALGSGLDSTGYALAVFGGELCVGGLFSSAGGEVAGRFARWNGARWVDNPVAGGLSAAVSAIGSFDDGNGPALYAGPGIQSVEAPRSYLARWEGFGWHSFFPPTGPSTAPLTMVAFDDGSGPALYVGGSSAGIPAGKTLERWDGTNWSDVDGAGTGEQDTVQQLVVFDDGRGPALYAGGFFNRMGGMQVGYVARWDGVSWSSVGGGTNDLVLSLGVFDLGSGPSLYAGGYFTRAGGLPAQHIARWDGHAWSALGTGFNQYVDALEVFDDGTGPALYAGGFFTGAGSVSTSYLAKWNGFAWSQVGGGLDRAVQVLHVHDDGRGPALFVGGGFSRAGAIDARGIARWDGASWSSVGSGVIGGEVRRLASFRDRRGLGLFVGGRFTSAPDSGDSYLARWGRADETPPKLTCPTVTVNEQPGTPPGEFVSFTVDVVDDQDPTPKVICSPPSGSFFPPGATPVTCMATDASGNQSVCRFLVRVESKARR